MQPESLPRLSAEQTAERLGVKLETLYAYVARGRLSRTRTADGSTFDPLEVERFSSSRRRRPAPDAGRSDGTPLMVIETGFALIEDGELYYRGRLASELAAEPFETVARWALTGTWDPHARFSTPPSLEAARRTAAALPPSAGDRDRQLVAVTALAASDPLRFSVEAGAVAVAAERLVAGMVAALPASGTPVDDTVAALLWSRLSERDPSPGDLRALDAALVLLLDHDLAVSTLAARAAASARANPYAVVVAGFGALDSPLHGNVSRAAHRMIARVLAGEEPARVAADAVVATNGPVPGFGHRLYPDGDPRAAALLALVGDTRVADAVRELTRVLEDRTGERPNVDLALAALAVSAGMRDDAGEVVFATARAIGWIVHALDEYARPPLRLRPVGRYIGRSPDGGARHAS